MSFHTFPYYWSYDDTDGVEIIRIFGINEKNETTYLKITDFTPYVYLELPSEFKWNENLAQMVINALERTIKYTDRPLKKSLVFRKKLYYSHVSFKDDVPTEKEFPFLFLTFATHSSIKKLSWFVNKPIFISGLGSIKLKIHESDASPILQLCSVRNILPASWVSFIPKDLQNRGEEKPEKESSCDYEYEVSFKKLNNYISTSPVHPKILSFDIECNSSNINAMPNASKPDDKVFQISCVLSYEGDDKRKKYLLSLGKPSEIEDATILTFETEADLLVGFTKFIREHRPNIVCGYNIFKFDIPYLLDRAKETMCLYDYDQQGFINGKHGVEKKIKWSSQAYKDQFFTFLDSEGILFIDLLPIIQRQFKLDTYTLKNVAKFFNVGLKGDLSAKGIFKCYRLFTPKALCVCAVYNIQDSNLCTSLFEKIKVWHSLTEMANVCNVPIFALFTQGQQIKVYSQVYKYCLYNKRVVEKDVYIPKPTDKFMGAFVYEPIPGLYEYLVSFDFSSLYPSIIVRYNICYSTLVLDETIPDDRCNVLEFDEHYGCIHDKVTHKVKIKKESIICDHCRFRFIKEPLGVIPTIIQNLLAERKKVKGEMEELKKKIEDKSLDANLRTELSVLIEILNQRQLALKVSANSMYGSFGVKKGYLPFMPAAKSTTGMGRYNIMKAADWAVAHGFKIVYGDTDSIYGVLPSCSTPLEYFNKAKEFEAGINTLFQKPMKMAFEGELFRRYLILAKKKYVAMLCTKEGEICDKDGKPMKEGDDIFKYIFKRGVLLARRDNAKVIREIYSWLITSIFFGKSKDWILYELIGKLNDVCSRGGEWMGKREEKFVRNVSKLCKSEDEVRKVSELWDKVMFNEGEYVFDIRNFIITKAVGEIGNYKIRELNPDPKKRAKRLKDLGCTEEEYKEKALPAHAQLAVRMRRRGKIVDPSERLEYIITLGNGLDDLQFNKIEDAEYYISHKFSLNLDLIYYIHLMITPIDQVLEASFGVKDFVLNQYEYRRRKFEIVERIKNITRLKVKFKN